MTDELHPEDLLAPAVAFLRNGPAVAPGLAERTRRRGRRRAIVRRTAGLGGLAAAVAVTAVILGDNDPPPGQITFALVAPGSTGVSLVGDFNDWERDRVRLHRVNGEWQVTLQLPPGRYRYSYLTDEGEWIADPDAPPALDEFGTPTSVITIPSET